MMDYVEFSDKSLLGWMWLQSAAAIPKNRSISLLLSCPIVPKKFSPQDFIVD